MTAAVARRALLAGALALWLGGAAEAAAPVRVFAAASLTEALGDAGRRFTAATDAAVAFSFASSGTIARQLAAGAPADLFVSADDVSMDQAVADDSVVRGTRRIVAANRLVLVARAGSTVSVKIGPGMKLAQALGPRGRLAVGDPAYVPAGRYAEQALTALGAWAAVAPRLARGESVRAALAYVSRGEAPLGIVYETDARLDPGVRIVGRFPAASHRPIVYPLALTPGAGPAARRFAAFLLSSEGQASLAARGFAPPPPPGPTRR